LPYSSFGSVDEAQKGARMARPYSQDLRNRVLAAYERGMQTTQIAETFAVSRAWARRVRQRFRERGERTPRPMGGPRVIKIDQAKLAALVAQRPDATIRELRESLGIACSESAVGFALQRLGLSFKKRRSMRPSRTARTLRNGGGGGDVGSRRRTEAD